MLKPVEKHRVREGLMGSDKSDGANGVFEFSSLYRKRGLVAIISDGLGWEHVSVYARDNKKRYIPSWKEMCQVKEMFWDEEDVVVQFHPKNSDYVNLNPYVLHLWRKIGSEFETPPIELV